MKDVKDITRLSQEEIKAFQEQKLKEQLAYIQMYSPYYQRLFNENTIDIHSIQTLDDLQKLPVTTKDDLQKYNADFFCLPQEKIIDYASTSGTTGKPIDFGISENDLERLAFNESESFKTVGITKHDTVQLMTTMDRRFMAGLAYFLGLRKIGASILRTGATIPALQWETILEKNPTYLITVPSFLLKLIQYAENQNIDINKTSIKAVICIGEPLRNQDFTPSKLTESIQRKWNVKLYSTYASTEMSTAFTECDAFQGGHAHPSLIITEVLDKNNQPVPSGEIGELTITTLGVEAMPLLRYKTGDLVAKYTEPCSCGRNTPRIGPVVGRVKLMIKYKGTTLFPSTIKEVIYTFEEIDDYIILLETNEIGTDDLTVKLVSSNQSEEFLQKLKEQFQSKARVIPRIEWITLKEFNAIMRSTNSRKPKRIIDNRVVIVKE